MHFPTAEDSIDQTADGATLSDWQRNNIQSLTASSDTYSGMIDWASVFYVPDLGPHTQQLEADGVQLLKRSYTQKGVQMHVIILYTPGSGHVLEIQSDVCHKCSSTPFGRSECGIGHQLPRDASFYRQAWENATTAADGWRTVGPAGLPAPIIVQIKQPTRDLEPAVRAHLCNNTLKLRIPRCMIPHSGRCTMPARNTLGPHTSR